MTGTAEIILLVPLSAKSTWHSLWSKVDNAFPNLHTGMLAVGVVVAVVCFAVLVWKLLKNIKDRGALKFLLIGAGVMFLVSDPGTVGGWFAQLMDGIGKAFKAAFHFFTGG